MRLLQVSDPHFGTEQRSVMDALLRLARELAPQVAVLSGDITQRARSRQFAAARAFVGALGIPQVLALPGNHDLPLFNLWQRVRAPYRNFQRAFGMPEPEIERDDLLLLAVNTTRAQRHKHGEVGDAQIDRVARRLRRASARQLRIVAVHQPMHVPRRRDEKNLLRNAPAAARAWAAAGADLVLGGHIHLPFVLPLSQRYTGLAREVWCVQAGTAVSARVRHEAPNSVNVVDYDPAAAALECEVSRWDHDARNLRFVAVERHRLALQR